MSGQDYLDDIRKELESGRHQHRMGENLLRAFGYVRRRATAIDEINAILNKFGLIADPLITSEMPLKSPRIRFSLKSTKEIVPPQSIEGPTTQGSNGSSGPLQDTEEYDTSLPEPAFSISELASANTNVNCVAASATIQEAFTMMSLNKYSQLVVANNPKPRQQDIKGIVSFQSMAKALMNSKPATVGDCIDTDVCFAETHTDLKSVVLQLSGNDVVLVIGHDKRLQGIVTAWDLAEEFAELVDPFKRIGEIEERLRVLVRKRLGKDKVAEFLMIQGLSGNDPIAEIEEMTMGELQRVLEFPENWEALGLAYDRVVFIKALSEARDFRNRLMHFRDPLNEAETTHLSNFCDMVREIPIG